jgi:LPXTG-motif cell wall-anchored protein
MTTNFDDDDLDMDDGFGEESVEVVETQSTGGNRNFIIAASILGAVFVLLVIVLLVVAFVFGPQRRASQQAANDTISTQNAATEVFATQAAEQAVINAQLLTPSVTPTATNTPIPPTATSTPVVAQPTVTFTATNTVVVTSVNGLTATVEFLLTDAVLSRTTRTITATGAPGSGVVTSTALPKTGFADEMGLPGLFGLSVVLLAVIILVRRLRLSTSS